MQRDTNYVQIERISADDLREIIDRMLAENNTILIHHIKQHIDERVGSQVKAPEDTPEYYTVAQVTEMLKVTRQTLNSWHKSGYLCKVTIGRSVRYPKSEIDRIRLSEDHTN